MAGVGEGSVVMNSDVNGISKITSRKYNATVGKNLFQEKGR
jgi:hypothetical protein